ncbi:neurogenic locus notch homolog protein 1-like [Mya arenaria]|uniref:neurogenic locus notch homolog protein 1-like n=1 Tax=Mya arenaria TaxID=6604 RepID=UPI0022E655C2|nr:neurogenic locus notch homolog protein 1-like [Mya arenaria]
MHGGSCQPSQTSPFYSCNCTSGYTGPQCQSTHCSSDPCHHGGNCQPTQTSPFYSCNCTSGYSGPQCQSSNCSSDPCHHGGSCKPSQTFPFYSCNCTSGFTGPQCQISPCASNPCGAHGVCHVSIKDPFYRCNCNAGYLGHNCHQYKCDELPCNNGGTCVPVDQSPHYNCTCAAGYYRHACDKFKCDELPCNNGGTCVPVDHAPYYNCTCAAGYHGHDCHRLNHHQISHVTQQPSTTTTSTAQSNVPPSTTTAPIAQSNVPPSTTTATIAQSNGTYQLHSSQTGANVCLECTDAVSPHTCTRVTICGSHESCYIDAYITTIGSTRYEMGCRDKQQCSVHIGQRSSFQGVVRDEVFSQHTLRNTLEGTVSKPLNTSDDDLSTLICSQCCDGELCNAGGCGFTGFPDLTTGSRGPMCFACDQQSQVDDCNTIRTCSRDEVCSIMQYLSPVNHQKLWKTTCIHEQDCPGLHRSSPSLMGKRDVIVSTQGSPCHTACCKSDICNRVCPN